jgi:hypothetical protein
MRSTGGPTAFVFDDHDLVRDAIQGMLKPVRLQAETSDGATVLVL